MTLIEHELTTAMRAFTANDEPSAALLRRVAAAPGRARARRRAAGGAGVLGLAALAGGGLVGGVGGAGGAGGAGRAHQRASISVAPGDGALPTAPGLGSVPASLAASSPPAPSPPAPSLGAAESAAAASAAAEVSAAAAAASAAAAVSPSAAAPTVVDEAGLLDVAGRVVERIRGAQQDTPLRLGPDLVSAHLTGVDLTTGLPPARAGSGHFGIQPDMVDPGDVGPTPRAPHTTSVSTDVVASRGDLTLVDATLTSVDSEGGSGETELYLVFAHTSAGWRMDTVTSGLSNGALGYPYRIDTTNDAALVADAGRAVASGSLVPPTHGTPVVVIDGSGGAVVDVPDVSQGNGDKTGTIRLIFGKGPVPDDDLQSMGYRGW